MTARGRPATWPTTAWLRDRRGRAVLGAVLLAALGLGVATTARGVTIAASASVSPSFMYLGDTGTSFTATVTNTGTVSLGAVEVERPSNGWTIASCPAGPAGWSIQQDTSKCRYRSANGTADDIAPGASTPAFVVSAGATGGPRDKTGTWKVRVSQTNSFSNPNTVVAASAAPPGLGNTAHAWQVLDAVVSDSGPVTPGSACPPSNREALTSSNVTIVICGRNRSSQAHTPSGTLSTLGGSFIGFPGTLNTASIAAQTPAAGVVIGNWVGATVSGSSGTNLTVVVQIRSALDETSPVTTLGGYHAINRPPTAIDDQETTDEDNAVDIPVLANDSDPENQALSVAAVNTAGTTGSVTNNGTDVTYDPNGQFDQLSAGETAQDTFSYTVSDGHGGTDTATVTVTITGVNDNPNAVDDGGAGFTTDEDTAFTTANVLPNDTDIEGDTLSVVGVDDSATQGLVVSNGDGTFDYDPNGAFGDADTDTFSYMVSDGNGGTDTATVTITITGVNDPPTAVDDAYCCTFGNTKAAFAVTPGPVFPLVGDVLQGNDIDPDDTNLAVSFVSATPGADVTVNPDGTFIYVPPVGLYNTTDSFTYRVTDPDGLSDEGTVEIEIIHFIVWYVDAAAAAPGDGRSTSPFTDVASLRGAGDPDGPDAIVFLYEGTYTGGLPLEAGQQLIGEPLGLTIGGLNLVPAAGSNPVITNASGDGIGLADGVEIRNVDVEDAADDGIAGSDVDGVTIRDVTVSDSGRDGIAGVNATDLGIEDVMVSASGRHGIHLTGSGAGSIGASVVDSTITDSTGTGLLVRGSGATTSELELNGSVFEDNGVGMNLVAILADDLSFDIRENIFLGSAGNAIQVITPAPTFGLADAEVVRGTIRGNQIGALPTSTVFNSGSRDLHGIAIELNGDADAVIELSSNVVGNTDQEGIFVQSRLDNDGDGDVGRLDLTLRDNSVGEPDDDSAFPFGNVYAVRLESRNTSQLCLDIADNNAMGHGAAEDFRLRQRDASSFSIERFAGDGTNDVVVASQVAGMNDPGSTASVTHSTTFTGVADGACRQP